MTDIGRMVHLAPARTQLHVNAYSDEALFATEQANIFKQSSTYVGHHKGVPNLGDWRSLSHENNGRVLVRGENGIELLSNVCRHRQALMLGDKPETSRATSIPMAVLWVPVATLFVLYTGGLTTNRVIYSVLPNLTTSHASTSNAFQLRNATA